MRNIKKWKLLKWAGYTHFKHLTFRIKNNGYLGHIKNFNIMKSLSSDKMAKLEGGSCQSSRSLLAVACAANSAILFVIAIALVKISCGGIDTTTT